MRKDEPRPGDVKLSLDVKKKSSLDVGIKLSLDVEIKLSFILI